MKTDSKKIKNLNLKPKMLKWLDENVGRTLQDTGVGKNFLNISTDFLQVLRSTADKQERIKLGYDLKSDEVKKKPTEREASLPATQIWKKKFCTPTMTQYYYY